MLVWLRREGVNLLKVIRFLWDRRKIYYISLFHDINFPKAASYRLSSQGTQVHILWLLLILL